MRTTFLMVQSHIFRSITWKRRQGSMRIQCPDLCNTQSVKTKGGSTRLLSSFSFTWQNVTFNYSFATNCSQLLPVYMTPMQLICHDSTTNKQTNRGAYCAQLPSLSKATIQFQRKRVLPTIQYSFLRASIHVLTAKLCQVVIVTHQDVKV